MTDDRTAEHDPLLLDDVRHLRFVDEPLIRSGPLPPVDVTVGWEGLAIVRAAEDPCGHRPTTIDGGGAHTPPPPDPLTAAVYHDDNGKPGARVYGPLSKPGVYWFLTVTPQVVGHTSPPPTTYIITTDGEEVELRPPSTVALPGEPSAA